MLKTTIHKFYEYYLELQNELYKRIQLSISGFVLLFLNRSVCEEVQIREAIFLLTGSCSAVLAFFWGIFYLTAFKNPTACYIAMTYTVTVLCTLVRTYYTRKFEQFVAVQLLCFLVGPSGVHVMLHGFLEGGGIIIWCIFAPICAFFMQVQYRWEVLGGFLTICTSCLAIELKHSYRYVLL